MRTLDEWSGVLESRSQTSACYLLHDQIARAALSAAAHLGVHRVLPGLVLSIQQIGLQ